MIITSTPRSRFWFLYWYLIFVKIPTSSSVNPTLSFSVFFTPLRSSRYSINRLGSHKRPTSKTCPLHRELLLGLFNLLINRRTSFAAFSKTKNSTFWLKVKRESYLLRSLQCFIRALGPRLWIPNEFFDSFKEHWKIWNFCKVFNILKKKKKYSK